MALTQKQLTPKTILLKGKGVRKEGPAGVAGIMPGYLVATNGSGAYIPHGVAAGNAMRQFALENELAGKGIETAYVNGEQVYVEAVNPGSEIFALVAASAVAIVQGDFLESAGDGTLRKQTASASTDEGERESVVAVALEAVDNSGGGTEARIKVEIV